MKSILVVVLVAVLIQGGLAAPSPSPESGLINFFGAILEAYTDLKIAAINGTAAILNSIVSELIPANAQVAPILQTVLNPLNTLLNNALIPATKFETSFDLDALKTQITNAINSLTNIGNQILKAKQSFMVNLFTKVTDRLKLYFDRITKKVNDGNTCFSRIIGSVNAVIQSIFDALKGNLNTCSAKLNSLNVGSAATTMNTYTANVTAIFNKLNANLGTQGKTLMSYINSTVTQKTVEDMSRTAGFLKNIADLYNSKAVKTDEFNQCLNASSETVGYVQQIISDNVGFCVNNSVAEYEAATASVQDQVTQLQTSANAVVTRTCDCVTNVLSTSGMTVKIAAQNCATNEAKNMNSATIQDQANAIEVAQQAKMDLAKENFDACIKQLDSDVADVVTMVNGYIDSCNAY